MPFRFKPGTVGTIFATFVNPNGAVPDSISDVKITIDYNDQHDNMVNILTKTDMIRIGLTNTYKFFWNIPSSLDEGTYLATFDAIIDYIEITSSDTISIEIPRGGGIFPISMDDGELKKMINDLRKEIDKRLGGLEDNTLLKKILKLIMEIMKSLDKLNKLIIKPDFTDKERAELRRIEKVIQEDIKKIEKTIGADLVSDRGKLLDNLKPMVSGAANEVGEKVSSGFQEVMLSQRKDFIENMETVKSIIIEKGEVTSKFAESEANVLQEIKDKLTEHSKQLLDYSERLNDYHSQTRGELEGLGKRVSESSDRINAQVEGRFSEMVELNKDLYSNIQKLLTLENELYSLKELVETSFSNLQTDDLTFKETIDVAISGIYNNVNNLSDQFEIIKKETMEHTEVILNNFNTLPNKLDLNMTDFSIKEFVCKVRDSSNEKMALLEEGINKSKENINLELNLLKKEVETKMKKMQSNLSNDFDNIQMNSFMRDMKEKRMTYDIVQTRPGTA